MTINTKTPQQYSQYGLLSYADMDDKDSEAFAQFVKDISTVHKPKASYGKNGYRFTSKHMGSIGGQIIVLPIECIADYVFLGLKEELDMDKPDVK